MGLDNIGNDLQSAQLGTLNDILSTLTDPFQKKAELFGADFVEGFLILEYQNAIEQSISNGFGILLVGNQMPFQPFTFGGTQKVVKEYYPGNSEPVVQVLGPREDDIIIKGRLKVKHFKNKPGKKIGSLYQAPTEIQKQMDSIRIRGNLLRIKLGEWVRWGFLEKTKFDLIQLSRVEYELTFSIIGFNQPLNCKFIDITKVKPFKINRDLIDQATSFEKNRPPVTVPKNFASLLNSVISDVAKAVSLVTNFVDTTVKTAEDVLTSVNRAIGLIQNARTNIAKLKRRLRTFELSITNLGNTFTDKNGGLGNNVNAILGISNNLPTTQSRSTLTTSTYTHASYINGVISQSCQLSDILARLQSQFGALAQSLPLGRYVFKNGDTLQKVAIKYYADANQWSKIYDHNKLTTTAVPAGTILEIPKL